MDAAAKEAKCDLLCEFLALGRELMQLLYCTAQPQYGTVLGEEGFVAFRGFDGDRLSSP